MKSIYLSRSFIFYSVLTLLSLLCSICAYEYSLIDNFIGKIILEYVFLLSIILLLVVIKKSSGTLVNINVLFASIFVFFLGNRVFFDILGIYSIEEFNNFSKTYVSIDCINRTILNLNIAIIGYALGYLVYALRCGDRSNKKNPLISYRYINKTHIYIMIFAGFIFKLYNSYNLFLAILDQGYLAYFLGEISHDRNFIEVIGDSFFEIGLFLLLNKDKKASKNTILILILDAILSMATGQRAFGLLFLLLSLFYLAKIHAIQLRRKTIIFLGFLFYVTSQLIVFYREHRAIEINELLYGFMDFFYSQGASIIVLESTIENIDQIEYSFADLLLGRIHQIIVELFEKISPDTDVLSSLVDRYKIFSSYISNMTNSTLYYQGLGIGGSYVAQFFAVGGEFLQFIGGVFVGYLTNVLYRILLSRKIFFRFISFHMLILFIYIPRSNLFDFLTYKWSVYIIAFIYFTYINMNTMKKNFFNNAYK
jgi:hypothetical protein